MVSKERYIQLTHEAHKYAEKQVNTQGGNFRDYYDAYMAGAQVEAERAQAMNPFIPDKKVPWKYFSLFDKEDRGHYFIEDQPVFTQQEADRLFEKYVLG